MSLMYRFFYWIIQKDLQTQKIISLTNPSLNELVRAVTNSLELVILVNMGLCMFVMSLSEKQFSGFVFVTHAAYSALCILLKVGCVLLSLISIFHAINTCRGFSLVLTEPRKITEWGVLARTSPFHRTTRQTVLVLGPEDLADQNPSPHFYKALKNSRHSRGSESPGAPPSPKTRRTTRCPCQPVTAPISHLRFCEWVDSDRFRPGRLLMLPFSVVSGLTVDFMPASFLISFGFGVEHWDMRLNAEFHSKVLLQNE